MTDYEIHERIPSQELRDDLRVLAKIADDDEKFDSSSIMKLSNWDQPSSTPFVVLQTDRFTQSRARLWTISHQGKIVGLSGVYPHNTDIAIIGARTWIVPDHRRSSVFGDTLFPIQEMFCREHGYRFMIMTFNLNNLWLPKMIMRASSGKALQMGRRNSVFYTGWRELGETHIIQNTPQGVLWKALGDGIIGDL